jgi:ABC-type nitrate/sulfonate/bicarbonate transport system permease component
MRHPGLWRLAIVGGAVGALEVACRVGLVDRVTMVPPSEMALALVRMMVSAPWFWADAGSTFRSIAAAILL